MDSTSEEEGKKLFVCELFPTAIYLECTSVTQWLNTDESSAPRLVCFQSLLSYLAEYEEGGEKKGIRYYGVATVYVNELYRGEEPSSE